MENNFTNSIKRSIEKFCPDGVRFVHIGEVVTYEQPTKYIVESTQYDDSYATPVLTAGQSFVLGYTNETHGIYNASIKEPVIIFDDFTGAFKWVDFPFKVKSSAMKILQADEEKTTLRYIFHIMGHINFSSDEHKRLWIGTYSNFSIPLPPLEVQQEIVRIMDQFTELTAELTTKLNAELAARKKQYEYYRDELLTFADDVPLVTLGDVAVVTKLAGFEFTKYVRYSDSGKIIALRGLNVKNGKLDLTDVKYIDNSDFPKLTRSKLHIGDMLFTYVGTIGQVALIDKEDKYYLAPNVALIRSVDDRLSPQYMRYYFQSRNFWKTQINKLLQSSSMQNIPMEKIRKFAIPLPSLEEQHRIVSILDRFDTLCNDLTNGLPAEIEARQKQYEYYRDKLLTFERSGSASNE